MNAMTKFVNLKNIILCTMILIGFIYIIHCSRMANSRTAETIIPEPPKQAIARKKSEEKRVKVSIKPEPMPQPEEKEIAKQESAPKADPHKAAKQESDSAPPKQTFAPSAAIVKAGANLTGKKGEKIGAFPQIVADYNAKLGINRYMAAMNAMGGRFYILDKQLGKIKCRIDVANQTLVPKGSLWGLSPRSRAVNNEPALAPLLEQARKEYGAGDYGIILLIPLNVDQYLIGALDKGMRQLNRNLKNISMFKGYYAQRGNELYLNVQSANMKQGSRLPLNFIIRLGQS